LTLQARTLDVLFFLAVATHRLPTKALDPALCLFRILPLSLSALIASVGQEAWPRCVKFDSSFDLVRNSVAV